MPAKDIDLVQRPSTVRRSGRPYRLTIVHPCVGRPVGMKRYIRTWMMEPIPAAMIAALAPDDVDVRFYDDRVESIPFDEPTDLVAISVETYTAKRSYQIGSEYRRRGVPVVMGGFHATLHWQEVARFADSVVIGEAEEIFPRLMDDYRHGCPERVYRATERPSLLVSPDRSIFRGKPYLPVRLVEFTRGCRFHCDFCAIQSFFGATAAHRPVDRVVEELVRIGPGRRLVFFVDDNITSNSALAKELMRALIPLKIRWVSQAAMDVAWDDEALDLMRRSGCQGLLIGFESLESQSLREMKKEFNLMRGGPSEALANLRRHRLRVYGTFVFGYDHDTAESLRRSVDFATQQGMFIAAFNHITPFPGTPLYDRLAQAGRLLYDAWWLDDRYRYGQIPFHPKQMAREELAAGCIAARRRFYSWPSIVRRGSWRVNWFDPSMLANYFVINAMHQFDIQGRNGLPLGDQACRSPLLEVEPSVPIDIEGTG